MDNRLLYGCLKQKVPVYFLPGADKAEKEHFGIDIVRAGAKPLPFGAF